MNAPIAALARYFEGVPKASQWPVAGWNAALDVTLRVADDPEQLHYMWMPETPDACTGTVLERIPGAAVPLALWLVRALDVVTADDVANELAGEKRIRVLNEIIDIATPDAISTIVERTNGARGTLRHLWEKGVGVGTSVMYDQIARIDEATNRDLYDVSISWYLGDKALAADNEQTSRQTREKLRHDYLNWYLQQPECQGSVTAKLSAAFLFGMALADCEHLDDLDLATLASSQTFCDLMFGPWNIDRERLCDIADANSLWEGFGGDDGKWVTITAHTYLVCGHPHLRGRTKERVIASLEQAGVAIPTLDDEGYYEGKRFDQRRQPLFEVLFASGDVSDTNTGAGHDVASGATGGDEDAGGLDAGGITPERIIREFGYNLVRGHTGTVGWLDLLAERFDIGEGGAHHDAFVGVTYRIFGSFPYEYLPDHVAARLAARYFGPAEPEPRSHSPLHEVNTATIGVVHTQACAAFGDNYNGWHEYLQLIAEGVEAPTALLVATADR